MDKRVLRERMRRKKTSDDDQALYKDRTLCYWHDSGGGVCGERNYYSDRTSCTGGGSSDQTVQAQADTEEVQANSDAAVRQPLKGKSDTDKIAAMTAGWHEDANGKWYQNTDGTYFSNGFQDIDGVTYLLTKTDIYRQDG